MKQHPYPLPLDASGGSPSLPLPACCPHCEAPRPALFIDEPAGEFVSIGCRVCGSRQYTIITKRKAA